MNMEKIENFRKVRKAREEGKGREIAVREFRQAISEQAKATAQDVMESLGRTAVKSLARLDDLVDSDSEEVALRATMYTLDHIVGKATQKTVSQITRVNIDVIADY